jgi:hypothetical protein
MLACMAHGDGMIATVASRIRAYVSFFFFSGWLVWGRGTSEEWDMPRCTRPRVYLGCLIDSACVQGFLWSAILGSTSKGGSGL